MTSNKNVPSRHGSAVVTLPSDTEILITRAFDYPAELVFRAWTTPALVKRWWGFPTSEWLVCEVDLRVGAESARRHDGRGRQDEKVFQFHAEPS